MNVRIKKASINDTEIISSIHALSWKSAYRGMIPSQYLDNLEDNFWVNAFDNWITKAELIVKIIFQDEKPVGCIAYGDSRDDKFSNCGEIVSIYILPDYFHKGYGQRLLDSALEDMKSMGHKNIYLWALEENNRARRFYEKNKFKYNGDKHHFEIMDKQLTNLRYILKI